MHQKMFGRARPSLTSVEGDPVVGMRDLPGFGVLYHPNYLRRLWQRGDFPKPTLLTRRKLVWPRSAILGWVAYKREVA